jgi:L-gulonolactone oxidase
MAVAKPQHRAQWRNWAANQVCRPLRIHHPSTEAELAQIVRDAAANGERVKVVGAGHSFTAIALTDGHLISLENYGRVLRTDSVSCRVTVESGIKLHRLNQELDRLGLAMPNLGDIDRQSISGAISTGTHGTGRDVPSGLASFVCGLRLITGDGSIVDCSADANPEVFHAARVGLGALGVISTVTLQCVPSFNLYAREVPADVDELLANLDEHIAANDHFEFYWVTGTRWALAKFNNRTRADGPRRSAFRRFRDDILYNNVGFAAVAWSGRLNERWIPRVARTMPSSGAVEYVDKSYRVFCSPRWIHFYEMEYSVPLEAAKEAVNRVRDYIARAGLILAFPVEVRFTLADDIPLSTTHGRRSCYIAVHVYQHMHYQQYFEAVEDIMDDFGGRPHWGKLHFQTAETLASRYPEWNAFQDVRQKVDPEGRFSNAYLERVLGPIKR